jgi:hypothetical protein
MDNNESGVDSLKGIIFNRIIKTMNNVFFNNKKILNEHLNDYNRLYPEIILEILYEHNRNNYTIEAIQTTFPLQPKNIYDENNRHRDTYNYNKYLTNITETDYFRQAKQHFYIPSNTNDTMNFNFDNFLSTEFVYVTMKKLKININNLNKTQYTKGNETIYGYITRVDKDNIYLEILYQRQFSYFMNQDVGSTPIPHKYISYITYDPQNTCNINDIPNAFKIWNKQNPCPLPPSGGKRKSKRFNKKKYKRSKRRKIVSEIDFEKKIY